MLMQRLTEKNKKKKQLSEPKWMIIVPWILMILIFTCYAVAFYRADVYPIVTAKMYYTNFDEFKKSSPNMIRNPQGISIKTEWYSDAIYYDNPPIFGRRNLLSNIVGFGDQTIRNTQREWGRGRSMRDQTVAPTTRQLPNRCDVPQNLSLWRFMMKYGVSIPFVIMGIAVCLTTFRFICKSSSQKLRRVAMMCVGFAIMAPMFVIMDIFSTMIQLQGQFIPNYEDWSFDKGGWLQVIAFFLMIVLEIFETCI